MLVTIVGHQHRKDELTGFVVVLLIGVQRLEEEEKGNLRMANVVMCTL